MRNLNNQDIEFLKTLQNQMLTQDKVCQASPRFWVVAQYEKRPTSEDYADGSMLIDECGEEYGETVEEAVNKLLDEYSELNSDDFDGCENFIEVIETLVHNDITRFSEVYYTNEHKIVRNTFFLTMCECKEHIQRNLYHYNQTVHSYAMTAWRSPQVEKLYEILENVDFSQLKEPGQDEV